MGKLQDFQIKLGWNENMFMPLDIPTEIFHYTSPSGFESILFPQKEIIELWASRYDCLNDYSEGTVAQERYKDVCKQMLDSGELAATVYDLLIDIKLPHTTLMECRKGDSYKVTRPEFNRYVCSFSKNSDSLAMWNYYSKGSKYEGFNLGFYTHLLPNKINSQLQDYECNVYLYSVIYDKNEQEELIYKFIHTLLDKYEEGDEISLRYMVSNQLLKWSVVFKKECFKHEEEVRLIVDVAIKKYPSQENIPQLSINYRITNGYTIPYIVIPIDKDCLSSVTIGPLMGDAVNKELQTGILKERFDANDFYVNVDYSKIPVRY